MAQLLNQLILYARPIINGLIVVLKGDLARRGESRRLETIDNEIDIFLLSKTNLITYLRFTLHWTFGQDSWEHAIKASLRCVPYGTHPTSNGLISRFLFIVLSPEIQTVSKLLEVAFFESYFLDKFVHISIWRVGPHSPNNWISLLVESTRFFLDPHKRNMIQPNQV